MIDEQPLRPGLTAFAIKTHWVLILIFAVLGSGAGAAVFFYVQPTTYTATAEVVLNPMIGNPLTLTSTGDLTSQVTSMTTEAEVATSSQVLLDAGLDADIEDAAANATATVTTNSQVLTIDYRDTTAQGAADGANKIAAAFLGYRARQAELAGSQADRQRRTQLRALRVKLKSAQRMLGSARSEGKQAAAAQSISAITGEIVTLRTTTQESSIGPGSVIQSATAPDAPDGVPLPYLVGAGALLGVVIAMAIAVARARNDPRLLQPASSSAPAAHGRQVRGQLDAGEARS